MHFAWIPRGLTSPEVWQGARRYVQPTRGQQLHWMGIDFFLANDDSTQLRMTTPSLDWGRPPNPRKKEERTRLGVSQPLSVGNLVRYVSTRCGDLPFLCVEYLNVVVCSVKCIGGLSAIPCNHVRYQQHHQTQLTSKITNTKISKINELTTRSPSY